MEFFMRQYELIQLVWGFPTLKGESPAQGRLTLLHSWLSYECLKSLLSSQGSNAVCHRLSREAEAGRGETWLEVLLRWHGAGSARRWLCARGLACLSQVYDNRGHRWNKTSWVMFVHMNHFFSPVPAQAKCWLRAKHVFFFFFFLVQQI